MTMTRQVRGGKKRESGVTAGETAHLDNGPPQARHGCRKSGSIPLPPLPMTLPKQRRFTKGEICAALHMQTDQFDAYVRAGVFPRGHRRGAKRLFWTGADLQACYWLEENKHRFAWHTKTEEPPLDDDEG